MVFSLRQTCEECHAIPNFYLIHLSCHEKHLNQGSISLAMQEVWGQFVACITASFPCLG
ncbi:unnamed protein product [Musa hybrid cultivar]